MYATATIKKIDNGFRAVFESSSERGLYQKGDEIFNRQFHPFPTGSLLQVKIFFSPKGRKMVKEIKVLSKPDAVSEDAPEETATITPKVETSPKNPFFFVSWEERLVFNTVLQMSMQSPERAVKVMMVGPSGYGKTSLPKLFASLANKNFLRMNCATVRDPEEWFGYREAREGSTHFVRSSFANALEEGNVVVVLDEFNRLEPWLHNTLFPLLDDDGATVVHDEKFTIGPGVIVVGTINTGYQFTGTFELDEALLNRFEFLLEVKAMPATKEAEVLTSRSSIPTVEAEKIVHMANILRQSDVSCSTRTTILIATMVASGLTVREAFETAVIKRIPVDSSGPGLRKKAIDLINIELGVLVERSPVLDIFNSVGEEQEVDSSSVRHKLTLFVKETSKVDIYPIVQFIRDLNVVGPRYSFKKSMDLCRSMIDGETVVIEVEDQPENLDALTEVGVSVHYSTVMG